MGYRNIRLAARQRWIIAQWARARIIAPLTALAERSVHRGEKLRARLPYLSLCRFAAGLRALNLGKPRDGTRNCLRESFRTDGYSGRRE